MKLWPRRSSPHPPAPRPDYTAIAILEYDLFGIQPEPGTTAAAIIAMRDFGARMARRPYVGPEFGTGVVGRPSPFLLESGERLLRPRR